MRLIDDSSERNFLDNRNEGLIKSCDLPIMSARPNNANDRKAYIREYIRRRRAAKQTPPIRAAIGRRRVIYDWKARRDEPGREVPIAKGYDRASQLFLRLRRQAKQRLARDDMSKLLDRVTSSAMRSDVFYPKAVRSTEVPSFPFGRQWAASMPSAGAALPSDSFLVGPSSC